MTGDPDPDGTASLLERRARLLGPGVPTFYDEPVHLVRGRDVWLWDAGGRRYLDCYNNVACVGHANPRVVEAIRAQSARLNTHSRYLHEGVLDYAERLLDTLDGRLATFLPTCTGSEANDAALRMAEAVTGKRGIVATDATYHGNTALVSQLGRSNLPGAGFGLDRYVRFVEAPDSYRRPDPDGTRFAAGVSARIAELEADGTGFAALVVCPLFLNEGFPDLADGWLAPAARAVRRAGGLLICDEVQSGFGRSGAMWAHERLGAAPDIVTLGKPMGGGHPVGGAVATREAMEAFRGGYRYFNTFAGNPVSAAAAMAVLEEIEARRLVSRAGRVGAYARERLRSLAGRHSAIGDVRGTGLVFGAELVTEDGAPAPELADRVVNRMRRGGVLLSRLGRHRNTLKIRPPLTFAEAHVDILVEALDAALGARPPA